MTTLKPSCNAFRSHDRDSNSSLDDVCARDGLLKDWFTSDTHFGHRNVIAFCERPFASIEEMNSGLIMLWNTRVKPEDRIYHLGDFALGMKAPPVAKILAQLNGYKILVMGNHDSHWTATKWKYLGFNDVFNRHGSRYGDFLLSHFPYLDCYPEEGRNFSKYQIRDIVGRVLLHGHVHRQWKKNGNMVNVGVDVWNYAPINMDEINQLIANDQP